MAWSNMFRYFTSIPMSEAYVVSYLVRMFHHTQSLENSLVTIVLSYDHQISQ